MGPTANEKKGHGSAAMLSFTAREAGWFFRET